MASEEETNKKLEAAAKYLSESFGQDFHFTLFVYTETNDGAMAHGVVSSLPPEHMNAVLYQYLINVMNNDEDSDEVDEDAAGVQQTLN